MPHRSSQVCRANKHAMHTVNSADVFEVFQRGHAFSLHQQTNFAIGVVEVIGAGVPARCPGDGTADAPNAQRRVLSCGHDGSCLLGAVHHGNQQILGTNVEQLLDQHNIA